MEPISFILINGILVLVLILYLLLKKRADPPPSRLRMFGHFRFPKFLSDEHASDPIIREPWETAKSLNVLFNYNGHTWDAYEVLGVPAGSNGEIVDQKYESVLNQLDPESAEFVQAAYDAIRKDRS